MWVTKKKLVRLIELNVDYQVGKAVDEINKQIAINNSIQTERRGKHEAEIKAHNELVSGWLKELRDHIMAAHSK